MTTHSVHPSRAIAPTTGYIASVVGSVLLGCGVTVTALGATQLVGNCNDISVSLTSLDTPAAALSVTLVDLPGNDAQLGLAEPMDEDERTSTATVPFLYLTPRVESMLREVFDDEKRDEDAVNWQAESSAIGGSKTNAPLPPIAEGNTDQKHLPGLHESDLSNADETIPHFQRPMYRTDI